MIRKIIMCYQIINMIKKSFRLYVDTPTTIFFRQNSLETSSNLKHTNTVLHIVHCHVCDFRYGDSNNSENTFLPYMQYSIFRAIWREFTTQFQRRPPLRGSIKVLNLRFLLVHFWPIVVCGPIIFRLCRR